MMAAGSPSGIVALGYRRSLIELRNNLGSLPGHLMFPVIAVVTISIVRHSDALAGRGGSFGNYALIGILLINTLLSLSLIHISEPTRRLRGSRMPSSA